MAETPRALTPESYLDKMREKFSGRETGPIPHDNILRDVRAEVDGNTYLFGQPDNHEPYVDISVFDGEPLVKGTKSLAQLTLHLPESAAPHVEVRVQQCETPILEKILETITPPGLEILRADKN